MGPPRSQGSSLVRLSSHSKKLLAALPDGRLEFVSCPADASCLWVLAATRGGAAAGTAGGAGALGRYTLRSVATGRYLGIVDGRVACEAVAPQPLHLHMDLERRVVLRLGGAACLQAASGGAAALGRLPLGAARASKLFELQEAGVPQAALRAWPMRCGLRCEQPGGGYLSACGGGALSAAAPAACCSEEFLCALGEAAALHAQAGSLVAPSSSLWTGDGRHLVCREPRTGQLLLAPQHACTGHERFTLQLSATGELRLLAESAAAAAPAGDSCSSGSTGGDDASGGSAGSGGGTEAQPLLPVTVRHGQLTTAGAAKPARFALELASHAPTLLLTAHGHALGCPPPLARDSGRPRGLLLPPGATTSSGTAAGPAPAALERCCAWRLEHHGDSVYTLRLCGRSLFVDDAGVPCLAAAGAGPVYPDERLLFWVEPGMAMLAAPAGAAAAGGSGGGDGGERVDACAAAAAAAGAPGPAAEFLLPRPPGAVGSGSSASSSSTGLTVAGFSVRSVRRVAGRHLYLSALPCGLLTTTFATSRPTRWELFTAVDVQTLLKSPLGLLAGLPCVDTPSAEVQAPPALRRAASMQALSSVGSASGSRAGEAPLRAHGSRGSLHRPPSLPAVQEHAPAALAGSASSDAALPAEVQRQQEPPRCGAVPRRTRSETALEDLQQAQQGSRLRPLWLAQLLQAPQAPRGWGLRSPAPLQELACRQLCACLAAQHAQQLAGGQAAPGLALAVEEELSAHLPQEIAARIGRQLRLLLEPPPPTKLPLAALAKAAACAHKDVPAWAAPHLPEGDAELQQWQPSEACLCCECRGGSGPLLPLDPYLNPAHHLFLFAMERLDRGGGRVRLRPRRRHDEEDLVLRALRAGKVLLLAWAAGRTLGAVLRGKGR